VIQSLINVAMLGKVLTGGSAEDAMDLFKYAQYAVWTNLAAAVAMLVGSVLAFPDFRRSRLPVHLVVIAIVCFAIACAALYWTHHVMSAFLAIVEDPDASLEGLTKAIADLEVLGFATTVKDLAYVLGLIVMIRTVRQSAVANEQFELRDASSTITQLLVVLLLGDVFYQLTYGLGSGGGGSVFPILGLLVAIGVGLYWIYCHLRLAKFLKAAAILVGEPHLLPMATAVKVPTAEALAPKPRPSAPKIPREVTAPSTPSAPIVVVAPEIRTAAPRAESSAESDPNDRPKFLS
jgi:hypothetical protein